MSNSGDLLGKRLRTLVVDFERWWISRGPKKDEADASTGQKLAVINLGMSVPQFDSTPPGHGLDCSYPNDFQVDLSSSLRTRADEVSRVPDTKQ